jgi:hypothetical protein
MELLTPCRFMVLTERSSEKDTNSPKRVGGRKKEIRWGLTQFSKWEKASLLWADDSGFAGHSPIECLIEEGLEIGKLVGVAR